MKCGLVALILVTLLFNACAHGSKRHPTKGPLKEQVVENAPDATPTPVPRAPLSRPLDPVGQPLQ